MSDQKSFMVRYNEKEIEFSPLIDTGRLKGYVYRCPKGEHRAQNWIDTESGTRHTLTFRDGKPTIRASILCSQKCGWHVFVTDGVAVDA